MSPLDRDHEENRPQTSPPTHTRPAEVRIAEIDDPETLNIYSLVLSAVDITHRIRMVSHTKMEIYVTDSQKDRALHELAAYAQENRETFELQGGEKPFTPAFRAMGPLVIGGLVLMYGVTGDWQPDSHWFMRGAGDSRAILQDFQFFRLVTPLTLHADLVHLLSNSILGVFLLHFFFHLTGNGIGLAALLLTAATANLLNVIAHGPGHLFVGFSTATFSVIGMLCTMSFSGKTPRFRLHFLMPVMAGLALLAFLGSSGERTDLGGHLFGLLCGLIGGNMVRVPHFSTLRASFVLQSLLGASSAFVVLWCWLTALS